MLNNGILNECLFRTPESVFRIRYSGVLNGKKPFAQVINKMLPDTQLRIIQIQSSALEAGNEGSVDNVGAMNPEKTLGKVRLFEYLKNGFHAMGNQNLFISRNKQVAIGPSCLQVANGG